MKSVKRVKNYFIKKESVLISIFVMALLVILYFFMLYENDVKEIQIVNAIIQKQEIIPNKTFYVIDCLEIVITVVVSIIISTLLSTWLIGKRDKEKIYNEAIDDLLGNSKIKMDLEKASNAYIETFSNELIQKKIPSSMIETTLTEIGKMDKPYYFEECNMTINCKIDGGYLVKEIKKEVKIFSYEDNYEFDGQFDMFTLAGTTTADKVEDPLKIIKINVEDTRKKSLNENNNYKLESKKTDKGFYRTQEYTKNTTAYYTGKLKLRADKISKITIVYETRTLKDDLNYFFRLPCACHKYKMTVHLKEMPDYCLNGYAFGFLDDATDSADFNNKDEMSIEFNKWMFPLDGVCILIKKDCN